MDKSAKLSITLEQTEPIIKSIGFYICHGNGSRLVVLTPQDLIGKTSFQKQRSGKLNILLFFYIL